MRMTHLLVTGLLLTAGMAAPALAGTAKPTEVKTKINVQMLSTQVGIEKVYQELRETAENNCRISGQTTLANRAFQKRCEIKLLNSFVADVDHDGLTAYHKVMKSA